MADNFVANPGAGGSTFAADDIGGVLYTRVKPVWGTDGSQIDTSVSSPMPVQLITNTSGGASMYSLVSAASANATNVKSSSGKLHAIAVFNTNAAVRYIKLYNSASAPTAGSGTPVLRFAIPGATTGGGFVLNFEQGIAFSSGIGFTLVTGAADADSTGVAASEILVNLVYI